MADPVEEYLAQLAQAEATGGPLPPGGIGNPAAMRPPASPLGQGQLTVFPENWRPGMAPLQGPGAMPAPQPNLPPDINPANIAFRGSAKASGPLSPGSLRGIEGQFLDVAKKNSLDDGFEEGAISSIQKIRGQQERNMGQVGEAMGGFQKKLALDQMTLQDLQKAQNDSRGEVRQRLADLTIAAKYANSNLPVATLRQYEQVRDTGKYTDPSGETRDATPEERKRAATELKKGGEIDPRRALRGWRGIIATIGAFLGGVGAAITRTPNYALEAIQNQIDRDIAAQKAAFDNKKAQIGNEINMYGLARQMGMDERDSILASNAMAWQMVDTLAKQMGIKNDALGSAAKTEEFKLDWGNRKLSMKLDALKGAASTAAQRQSLAIQESAAAAKKSAGKDVSLPTAIQELRELIAMRDEYSSETAPFSQIVQAAKGEKDVKSIMEGKAASLLFDVAKLAGQGALQAPDREIAEAALGKATGYGPQVDKMRELLQRWERLAAGQGAHVSGAGRLGEGAAE